MQVNTTTKIFYRFELTIFFPSQYDRLDSCIAYILNCSQAEADSCFTVFLFDGERSLTSIDIRGQNRNIQPPAFGNGRRESIGMKGVRVKESSHLFKRVVG